MGKIKIGIGIFVTLVLIGLFLGIVVFVNPSEGKTPGNGMIDYAPGQIVVKFKGDPELFRVIKVPEGKVMEKVKEYQAKAEVVYAEPDYLMFALVPSDTYYQNQWALNNTGQTIHSGCNEPGCNQPAEIGSGAEDADIDWEEAYPAEILGQAVVAVVDSGIDLGHPDLDEKVISGYDFVDEDLEPADVYGHGTHVAGISGAETDNALGIAGVAFPNSIQILAIRVLDENGMGYTSDVAAGIKYAADYGIEYNVKVAINLSLGGRDSQTLKEAVNYAWDKGALLAGAAGNDGGGRKYYPASYPNVISVAATDYNDKRASFSNFNDEVDVSAPGVNVFSTFPTYPFTIGKKYGCSKNYDVGSGTSMSVPHVAGLAALLFAQDSGRTNADVKAIIEQSANDLGTAGWDRYYGWGRINVYAALSYASCTSNTDCASGEICCSGECAPAVCSVDADCNDAEACTINTCNYGGTCDAYCSYTEITQCIGGDGCCPAGCDSTTDSDCPEEPAECLNCFKGVCDGRCHPVREDATCPDCQQ